MAAQVVVSAQEWRQALAEPPQMDLQAVRAEQVVPLMVPQVVQARQESQTSSSALKRNTAVVAVVLVTTTVRTRLRCQLVRVVAVPDVVRLLHR